MSQHVPDDLLRAFAEGDLGDTLAAHVAEHLDECPACATRAVALEPLAAAFASVSDPPVPPDLAARVLEAASRDREAERAPVAALVGGGLLLVGSGAALLALDGPLATLADLGVVMSGLSALGRGLATSVGASPLLLGLATGCALAGLVATLHYSSPERLDGPRELLRRLA